MTQINLLDDIIGTSPSQKPRLRSSLKLGLSTVTAADLIRFRVEDSLDRGVDDPVIATRADADLEQTLNNADTAARSFSAVTGAETARLRYDAATSSARIAAAVETALKSFEAGAYLLIVNDEQIEMLDTLIPLKSINEACFVRLLPLQGG